MGLSLHRRARGLFLEPYCTTAQSHPQCPAVHHREVATLRELGEQMTHRVRAVGDAGEGGGACILPTVCLLSSPPCESRHPVMFFFRYEPLLGFFFFMFWSFQPQTDSRSADIRKPLMPLDTHGNTLAGHGRTTEVFCLSPCGSGGASSYFFFLSFFTFGKQTGG